MVWAPLPAPRLSGSPASSDGQGDGGPCHFLAARGQDGAPGRAPSRSVCDLGTDDVRPQGSAILGVPRHRVSGSRRRRWHPGPDAADVTVGARCDEHGAVRDHAQGSEPRRRELGYPSGGTAALRGGVRRGSGSRRDPTGPCRACRGHREITALRRVGGVLPRRPQNTRSDLDRPAPKGLPGAGLSVPRGRSAPRGDVA